MKNIKAIFIGIHSFQKRLEVLQERIEECEGNIPAEFWCSDCHEIEDKTKRLMEKVVGEKAYNPFHYRYGNSSIDPDWSGFRTLKPDGTVVGSYYLCTRCNRTWHKRNSDEMTYDSNSGRLECKECGGAICFVG